MAELYHYGVKGMRWGHRKQRIASNGRLQKRRERGFKDARNLSTAHAKVEDMNRILGPAAKEASAQGKQLLVPSDIKDNFSRGIKAYETMSKKMNRRYKDVFSEVITDNGKDYVYTLLQDRKTGEGYEIKTELKVKR